MDISLTIRVSFSGKSIISTFYPFLIRVPRDAENLIQIHESLLLCCKEQRGILPEFLFCVNILIEKIINKTECFHSVLSLFHLLRYKIPIHIVPKSIDIATAII